MIEFLSENEYYQVKAQRKKVIAIYVILLAIYLGASVAVLLWHLTLTYMSPKLKSVKIIEYSMTAVFVIFSFIYLGICYKRVTRYYKLMKNLRTGLKKTYIGNFFEYDESIREKDGVDFKSLIFLEWNESKGDFYERKVLVYSEKPFPIFKKNSNVKYVTQGNVLVSYEILDEQ